MQTDANKMDLGDAAIRDLLEEDFTDPDLQKQPSQPVKKAESVKKTEPVKKPELPKLSKPKVSPHTTRFGVSDTAEKGANGQTSQNGASQSHMKDSYEYGLNDFEG